MRNQIETSYFTEKRGCGPRYQSILFTSADGAKQNLDIDGVISKWEPKSNPLILISHFSLDVLETLKALSVRLANNYYPSLNCQQTQWMYGSKLLDLNANYPLWSDSLDPQVGSKKWLVPALFSGNEYNELRFQTIFEKIANLPETLFILDFSKVDIETLFSASLTEDYLRTALRICDAIKEFCKWFRERKLKHRLVIGISRPLLSAQPLNKLVNEPEDIVTAFHAAPLFDDIHKDRVSYLEGITKLKLPKQLRSLFCANSNSLIHETVIALIKEKQQNQHTDAIEYKPDAGSLIKLSNELTDKGFYEIAYRLELYCESLEEKDKFIVRNANFYRKSKGSSDTVIGFLKDASDVLQAATKVIVRGEAGVGKSVLLRQIERKWQLPQFGCKRSTGYWLPISISLPGKGNRIEDKLLHYWGMPFTNISIYALFPCRTMLKKLNPAKSLKWLFGSPILLLVDGLDEVNYDLLIAFSDNLIELFANNIIEGVVCAKREDSKSPYPSVPQHLEAFPFVELTALSIQQIGKFLEDDNYPEPICSTIISLLKSNENPIALCLRNPFLLHMGCVICRCIDLKDLNRGALIKEYINLKVREGLPEIVVGQRLPELALKMKEGPTSCIDQREEDKEWQAMARDSELLEFYDYSDVQQVRFRQVRFKHELLLDYFAANALKYLIEDIQCDIEGALRAHSIQEDTLGSWLTTLEFLLCLLEQDKEKLALLNYVGRTDELRALKILSVLQPAKAIAIPGVNELINEINRKYVDHDCPEYMKPFDEKKKIFDEMGLLDPRFSGKSVEPELSESVIFRGTKFFPAKYPITNLQYSRFINDKGYERQEFWNNQGREWLVKMKKQWPKFWHDCTYNKANYPVVGVNIFEALAYCSWLNSKAGVDSFYKFTLPTMEQWDFFALVETEHDDLKNQDEFLNHTNSIEQELTAPFPRPVGMFPPSELGCYDIFGNIWEWCDSWLVDIQDRRPSSANSDHAMPTSVKGGPCNKVFDPMFLLLGSWMDPYQRYEGLGFRVIAVVKENK